MQKLITVLVLVCASYATLPTHAMPMEGLSIGKEGGLSLQGRILISAVGDVRAVLGPQGKNIIVCDHGDHVAVVYGDPTPDPDNCMEVKTAYSTDSGATWALFGPFSGELRRIYVGLDGTADFCTNPAELWFYWMEPSGVVVMSCSTYAVLPYPGLPSIAVSLYNQEHLVATSWSSVAGRFDEVFAWQSYDSGRTWSYPSPICFIDETGYSGHLRFGTNQYAFYSYGDLYDWHGTEIVYPYYIESAMDGQVWGMETALPEVPVLDPDNSQFWWHEMDCEVINNEPWAVHNDINQVNQDSADMWVFHGTGAPGGWTWDITGVHDYDLDTVIADTAFIYEASQYPSVAYDPVSNTVLVTCKAYYFKAYPASAPTDTFFDGAHIGGIYSTDDGMTWHVTQPLSEPNIGEIPWQDWNATEVAHRLVNCDGDVCAYSLWVHEAELNLYFERGLVKSFIPLGVEEYAGNTIKNGSFTITPSVAHASCWALFVTQQPGIVVLDLYDASGRLITRLHNGYLNNGEHRIGINTNSLANGSYFVVLESNSQTRIAKFVIAR